MAIARSMSFLPREIHSSGVPRSCSTRGLVLPPVKPASGANTASLRGEKAQEEGSGAGAAVMARSSARMMLCVKWSSERVSSYDIVGIQAHVPMFKSFLS